jgi:uncharacterized protein DUF5317
MSGMQLVESEPEGTHRKQIVFEGAGKTVTGEGESSMRVIERFWIAVRIAWIGVFIWDEILPSSPSHVCIWLLVPFVGVLIVKSRKNKLSKFGASVFLSGALLNGAVILANGGMMPVDRPDRVRSLQHDRAHVTMQIKSRLKPLADVIYFGQGIASLGDLLIFMGCAFLAAEFAIRKLKKSFAEQSQETLTTV